MTNSGSLTDLIDIGANLSHKSFDHDREDVMQSAKAAGVAHIIVTGTDLTSSREALRLASGSDGLSCTAGFHPHVANQCSDFELEQISTMLQSDKVVAVGETGLDFNRNYSPQADQERVYRQHLEIAIAVQKPLFLHQRDAHDSFFAILKQYRSQICGGVVHCFTDTEKALDDYLELDMYIGITGWICDERRGRDLQQMVGKISPNRLLLETDAPYLLPRNLNPRPKTRRNEPRYLTAVLETVAQCTGRSVEQLAGETATNAKELFKLIPQVAQG
ncbi:MAG: TatD family hydrolase [Gammaproteobacteria bacterium]|jgi:TatD DNase family protein|nr:hydrolase TatD [Gammaproteobacteria bacterium]MDP6097579.1 TatD family hydrolase [Gammaproteobacteria bacterium]MDP7455796.1 TatD family hydrolase [Gammaproteobacteria bacterium]HJO11512.1 TatD family hydrolase [Gammaproteobacteria bacterium]|tara:strand:+ start:53 stop:877 length:825 start_codon:yes stop_codon:yes gene_type:complete